MTSQSASTPVHSSEDGNNECAICHEAFNVSPEGEEEVDEEPVAGPSSRPVKRARLMPEVDVAVCGHMFHKFCIYSWFKSGGKVCPLCRKKTTKRGLRRIFNFPSSSPQEGRSYEDEVVEEMKVKLQEEKGKVEGMEVMMKQMLEEVESVQGELEGKLEVKGKEVEELKERVEGLTKQILEVKGKEMEELKEKVDDMIEVAMNQILEEVKGFQGELEGKLEEKGKEVEELKERVAGMKEVQRDLERNLEEKGWEVEFLKEKLEDVQGESEEKGMEVRELKKSLEAMQGIEMELEGKRKEVEERRMEVEGLREDLDDINNEREFDRLINERKLKEMAKDHEAAQDKLREDFEEVKGEMEEKLKVEQSKSEFAERLFVEKMEQRVSEDYERMKREKEVGMRMRDLEAMYKMSKMERDREMGKASYFENWCKRLVGIEEGSTCDVADLTEVMRRKLNGATMLSVENGHQPDLSESESDDDHNEEHDEKCTSVGGAFPFQDSSEEDKTFSDDNDNF